MKTLIVVLAARAAAVGMALASMLAVAPGSRAALEAGGDSRLLAPGTVAPFATTATAREDTPEPVSQSGMCTGTDILVPADADAMRPFVSPRFPLVELGGRAVLLLGAGRCEETVLDGEPVGTYEYAEAWTLVRTPDGGGSLYSLWQLHDNAAVHAAWHRLGIYGDHIPVEVDLALEPTSGRMTVSVPWPVSPHSVTIDGIGPGAPVEQSDGQQCDPSTGFWHEGAHGDVRIAFKISQPLTPVLEYTSRLATGEVRAAPGSPLATMIGGESVMGAAALRRFRYDACLAIQRGE